jgi:dipeptidyl aminopeptidase/acylaminoacyl peptidase
VTSRPSATKPPRDPYGLGPIASHVGPIAAAIALFVVGAMTLGLMNGQIPFKITSSGSGAPGPALTPAPSGVVLPEPAVFKGSIVYAKAGNIWIQTTDNVRQLTSSGLDSMPSFSPDGRWVYVIRVQDGAGLYGLNGAKLGWYDLETPQVSRVPADGSASDTPEAIFAGRLKSGRSPWFSWIRQPVVSPDGNTIAVVSDAPASGQSAVVLQLYDMTTRKLTNPNLAQTLKLGHQDPAWRPDGTAILYVKNGRNGARGAPQIMRYVVATGKATPFTGPGYLAPSWSPDGRYVAATRSDNFGTDIVILDTNGAELLRVTNDDHSFSPAWSPTGDSIAFLHLAGQIVDLDLARLDGSNGTWTVKETVPLTQVSGLDAASRPSWFVPPSDLPSPAPGSSSGGSAPAGSAPDASTPAGSSGSTAP